LQKFVGGDASSFFRKPTQGFALLRLQVDFLGVVQNNVHVLVESLSAGQKKGEAGGYQYWRARSSVGSTGCT
jgi:hypothetical protein